MRRVSLIFCLSAVICLSGCIAISPAARQCRAWQSEGQMYSTLDACKKCVEQLGENIDAVRGCAVGVDAATVMSITNH